MTPVPPPVTAAHRLGLRSRIVVLFALGALVVSIIATAGTYFTARSLLINQRERVAVRQAITSSHYVAARNPQDRARIGQILGAIPASPETLRLIHDGGTWYSAEALSQAAPVPREAQERAEGGEVAFTWTDLGGRPALVVAVPLPEPGMTYYEVNPSRDLQDTLTTLRGVLTLMAALATLAGAAVGWLAARRSVRPLHQVAEAGARIGAGELDARLPPTRDPELQVLTSAFNSMADQVQARIDRDSKFAAEVGHELRSPLTTLMAAVGLLKAQRDQVPPDAQLAIDLADQEVQRFGHTLEDLLRLGALDGGQQLNLTVVRAEDVARATLLSTRRDPAMLVPSPVPDWVEADKERLSRALSNLLDNADYHAGGVTGVRVVVARPWVRIIVEDRGPGVPEAQRDRIFERFVRGGARGSKQGTGLGLSIVAETVRAHGGEVAAWDRAGGGAEFVISLPLREAADG